MWMEKAVWSLGDSNLVLPHSLISSFGMRWIIVGGGSE